MKNKTSLMILGTFSLILILAGRGLAASTVAIIPSGENTFLLQGTAIENAAAMDITVSYDASTLGSARVAQGELIAGAMMAVNDTTPGTVRMGIVRTTPVKGNGVIATLTFDRMSDAPGTILALRANLSNINGKPLPVSVQIPKQAADPPAADDFGSTSSQVSPVAAAASSSSTGGAPALAPIAGIASAVVSGNQDKDGPSAAQSGETSLPAEQESSATRIASLSSEARDMTSTAQPSEEKIQQYKSVLERFRDYKGKRTSQALVNLFERDDVTGFRQHPPIALSDGKTKVRVTFISASGNKTAADVAVMGARLASLKKDPDNTNTWIAELVPEKDVYQVSVAVSEGLKQRVYPLTIAPKIGDKSAPSVKTAKDFDLYLSTQRRDVNNDNKINYLDDYIVTANYLVNRQP